MTAQPRIAVLVPCRNEAATVGTVVADFRAALPQCAVYVYDNGSVDGKSPGCGIRALERQAAQALPLALILHRQIDG